jgi:hypothetical protein
MNYLLNDEMLHFGSEVKSVFTILVDDFHDLDPIEPRLYKLLAKNLFAYYQFDGIDRPQINELLQEFGVTGRPSLIVKIDTSVSNFVYAVNLPNIEAILTYIEVALKGDSERAREMGGDSLVIATERLTTYLYDTLRVKGDM